MTQEHTDPRVTGPAAEAEPVVEGVNEDENK